MPNIPIFDNFFYFTAFDKDTHSLLYCKYNFNFDTYSVAFGLVGKPKDEIFFDFLIRNGTTFDTMYSVIPSLTQYFNPITQQMIDYVNKYGSSIHTNYMQIKVPLSYLGDFKLYDQQFDMIEYTDNEIRRIQDFIYKLDGVFNTKWNFDFDTYSLDFNTWGTKLLIFTDMVIRNLNLSNTSYYTFGYGMAKMFNKYFLPIDALPKYCVKVTDLNNYITKYGVTSNLDNVYKSINNINYKKYCKANPDIITDDCKNHYLTYGQFELRKISFISTIDPVLTKIYNCIGTIFTPSSIGSCFLFNNGFGDKGLYLITCNHIVSDLPTSNTILATFELQVEPNMKPISQTAQFKTIGRDYFADVLVALYDPLLDYNVANSVSMAAYTPIEIDFTHKLEKGDIVSTLQNIGNFTNASFISGSVMDPLYDGVFPNIMELSCPDSVLINMVVTKGISGSPLFTGDVNKPETLKCIGMMNGFMVNNRQYSLAINGFILADIVANSINKWYIYADKYANNPEQLNYFTSNSLTKRWLGIKCYYYNPTLKFPNIGSLNYTGGLVIDDFIIGFDYTLSQFVTGYRDNSTQNIIPINTPLINTKMYNKFIQNNRVPIVLKSMTLYDNIQSIYSKFYLGKFSGQVSYSHLVYGIAPIGNFPADPKYTNTFINLYGDITLEYYYFNGLKWVLDVETIGGSTPEYYNEYDDRIGHSYYQHQNEFPFTLLPYINTYLNDQYSNITNLTTAVKAQGSSGVKATTDDMLYNTAAMDMSSADFDPIMKKD